jgi:DNA-binding NarL/FixJ family response regulator
MATVLVAEACRESALLLATAIEEGSNLSVVIATDLAGLISQGSSARPQVVLLGSDLSGLSAIETIRAIKKSRGLINAKIVVMSATIGTAHLEAVLDSGAADYVPKPVNVREIIARVQVQQRAAQQTQHSTHALDAFGFASMTVDARSGHLVWQTALSRDIFQRFFETPPTEFVPVNILEWLQIEIARPNPRDYQRLVLTNGQQRLTLSIHGQLEDGEWLVVQRETSDRTVIELIGRIFQLTARESEVLYWVVRGKINRDIGDIVGASPATVKKHLERVFEKLCVETRTAAAAMALSRIRGLDPSFDS